MFDDEWNDGPFPLAYLVTFRCFGTWLHGDGRGSVDAHGKNIYGTPDIALNSKLEKRMREKMGQAAFLLDSAQRLVVEDAVREVCEHRKWILQAVNARTNHVHAVVSVKAKPEPVINAFKSYATRKLRDSNLLTAETRPWSRGGSRRYLWKPRHVALAIEYVLYGQGDVPFEVDDSD
ncbi:MAG: transposase [Rubrivivax sp.]|nr:transposase [Pyrinomonadaceae bacterium]